jgi:hypothetical protein
MTVSGIVHWLKLAIMVLGLVLRLLLSLPRLRKEAREAVNAAGLAYKEAWEALADRSLTREEVMEVRRKLEAFGKETEDVLKLLAQVLGLEEES